MNDRDFAIRIRRLLLSLVAEIEKQYKLGKYAVSVPIEIGDSETLTV